MKNSKIGSLGFGRMTARKFSLGFAMTGLLSCLLFASQVMATEAVPADEAVETAVTISKESVQVAETFGVEIRLSAPKGTVVTFPDTGMTWGPFDVLDYQDRFAIPAADGSAERTWTRSYTLETIETGELELPALELQIESSVTGNRWVERTAPQKIRVLSVLENQADPLQFRDIKGPIELTVSETVDRAPLNGWVVGLGAVLVLGFVALAFARRRKWSSPREWAQSEIQTLRDSHELRGNDIEFCVGRLDEILRSFLEWQFSIPAIHMTGSEIYNALQEAEPGLPESDSQDVLAWFQVSEQAKFAGSLMAVGDVTQLPAKLEMLLDQLEAAFMANSMENAAPSAVAIEKGES